jgi:hypothetical protein|tara:strand:- start:71 stop:211 length:141 start_codon:yes stop_codon:yes gene_type:complete
LFVTTIAPAIKWASGDQQARFFALHALGDMRDDLAGLKSVQYCENA